MTTQRKQKTDRRKMPAAVLAVALALILMLMTLGGCGKNDAVPDPTGVAVSGEPVSPAVTAEPAETEAVTSSEPADPTEPAASSEPVEETDAGRQDGERFEAVITLEGMEETIQCEHARNEMVGFELDYEYEALDRHGEADRERFISCYEDPEDPWNYLEVRCSAEEADAAAAAVQAELSGDFDTVVSESWELDRAGTCVRISASGAKESPDSLQTVYVIPAADGCRIAAAHCTFESAEGFGARFSYTMNTFAVIDRQGGKRLSDEQALSAIRNYCIAGDPDLVDENSREQQVYWDISSSDDSEIVVLFRTYTGALIYYHVDPVSGDTYATEVVPGFSKETRMDESLNAWDYLN